MNHSIKKGINIFFILPVFLFGVLFVNTPKAEASIITDLSTIFSFINNNIIQTIKNDFCRQYILSISSGEWKVAEFRTNLGKKFCATYTIPTSITTQLSPTALQSLNQNVSIFKTEAPSTSSVNNPAPDIYVPDLNTSIIGLDAGQILFWTNVERKNNSADLVNLKENSVLKNIALIRVKDMFANSYFAHNSPSGDNASKEAEKNGYTYITIGENIALGNFDGSRGLLTSWMNSPGHKANILNNIYTEIGVYAEKGIYKGHDVWIAAQIFGKSLSGCKQPDNLLADKIAKYKVSAEGFLNNIKNLDIELKTLNATDTQIYNTKVAERNTLASLYNNLAKEIKASVAEYNKQAANFNSCIKTI